MFVYSRYAPDTLPYGTRSLLNPRRARDILSIGDETLRRTKPNLPRLEIMDGFTRRFPRDYIVNLAALALEVRDRQKGRISTPEIAELYAHSEAGQAEANAAKAGFEEAFRRRLYGNDTEGLAIDTAAAMALLGLSNNTIETWYRSDFLAPQEIINADGTIRFAYPEAAFRRVFAWHQPDAMGPAADQHNP